ncbi:MAG: membrane-bound O-acyltransferase family protein [candidate division Zixibacteria bacterium CG_4_9_14_3_um_filter_46_8]|nr:MAG: membrane-bound O-acyltransferase family protein [candidate division Zixibacteria bacterium CG_4_9_14_3_um_filter_46_8]
MLFNSLHFAIFFPIVLILYFALPHRFRWIVLLAASYYFYMAWKPEYIILLIITTSIDYYAGIRMGRQAIKSKRTKYLILSLTANFLLLFSFKYFNFFNESLRMALQHYNIFYGVPALKVLLPVGISFYTFQSVSYAIDVYRGVKKPEPHPGIFAVYVAFFPQLVAGPIERSTSLLPQFSEKHSFDYREAVDGLKLMAWGFFKKMVIADHLAYYVNAVYNKPADHTGLPLLIATYFFALQIFCDFSGYSDIAIGSARIMGFRLMTNFNQPYYAQSIAEFWKRWHISLSTWFKDYFYISLGGNRVSKWRWYFNLGATFLVSGLWHGANWTFIVWGGLHGFYMILSILTERFRNTLSRFTYLSRFPKLHKYVKIFITYHLVLVSWVFFRANSLSDALFILRNMFNIDFAHLGLRMFVYRFSWEVAIPSILTLVLVHWVQRRISISQFLTQQPFWVRWPIYYVAVMYILIFGQFSEQAFIYFQF